MVSFAKTNRHKSFMNKNVNLKTLSEEELEQVNGGLEPGRHYAHVDCPGHANYIPAVTAFEMNQAPEDIVKVEVTSAEGKKR